MTTKQQLLTILEGSKGVYLSGETIAGRLQVSRAAVWKAVRALQNEGYGIEAVQNRGYCLAANTDILSPQGIQKYLLPVCAGVRITVLPVASSTNAVAREQAEAGAPEGYLVLANEQNAGRGRRGRGFFAPPDTGIYMSLLLRPKRYAAEQAVRITSIAAVAMCEAIEAVSEERAEIKWINDIFIRGKKVCGILTEASFGLENGLIEYAVLGVGVNVYEPQNGFPEELREIAGAVFAGARDDMKNRLTAEFLNRFMAYYAELDTVAYAKKYRDRSLAVGKRVTVISGDRRQSALALGVDDECRLLVRYDDGREACLSSGEISIRLPE